MRSILGAVFTAVALVACSSVSLPPKAGPEEVALINPAMGQAPEEGYKVIGPVTIVAPLGATQEQLIMMMRTEAAKMGADALILEGIAQPEELAGAGDREEGLRGRGRAIYYPSPSTAN